MTKNTVVQLPPLSALEMVLSLEQGLIVLPFGAISLFVQPFAVLYWQGSEISLRLGIVRH